MKATRYILSIMLALAVPTAVQATDYIRYVSKKLGSYNNDGTSWKTSKVNVQDAINDIKDEIGEGDRGFVFVDEGSYKPTQSVAGASSSTLYMSIQIPAGVRVYGGFTGVETGSTAEAIIAKRETVTTEAGTYMKNQTVFTGSLSSNAQFVWNDTKHRYATSFFGNCYHVVWFATNGYTTDAEGVKHYNALADSAILDGVIIRDGYAYNRDINVVEHNAFGGGAYLVGNAVVRNCEVFHCEASRGGGGLYLDNGGLVENCFVHDCQTLGVNSTSGFGGGVAVNQKGLVTHCALINNVGRSGGGLSLNYDPERGGSNPSAQYQLAVRASLIAQNVATVEAGGLYLEQGGLVNGVTIVKNKTYGTGVTLNGIVTGRSGGVYVRDHARIYNSVLWGNEAQANNTNNVQYAATRSSADERLKPSLAYVALSRADYTDWSGTKKIGINKLADDNQGSSSNTVKYPLFSRICVASGHIDDQSDKSISASSSYLKEYLWRPTASSGLCYAGLQLLDISEAYSIDLSAGFIINDLKGLTFSPKCALGAYTAEIESPKHAVIGGKNTIFVDPDRASGANYTTPGVSWDSPMDNLTDALTYFANLGEDGQIFVKEGTLYTAARSAHGRMRGTSIEMVSGVSVMGGYSAELKGTDLSKRNPVAYQTIITGKVSENDYPSNVAHLVTFDGVTNAVLDGFQLRLGNALSAIIDDYGKNGAGVWVKNNANATLLNTSISDCTAKSGAAVYVESGTVTAENCIFRNCESSLSPLYDGIIYVNRGASMTINHCDIVRNVGYAVANNGSFTSYNTLYYSNMKQEVEDTNGKGDKALAAFTGSGNFDGDHNLFDQASVLDYTHIPAMGSATLDWTFSTSSTTYPRFVNSTKNAGVSVAGDVTYYGLAVDYTPSDMNPVVNAASTNDVAHTSGISSDCWGKDMTTLANRDFGGLPDVGALENGAFKANSATQPKYGTTFYVRDYRNADGTVDYTSGGNGYSWKGAINGNAWYDETTGQNMKMAPVDYTYRIQNAHLYSTAGWTCTQGYTDHNKALACVEFYNKTFDFYQNLSGLPNGWYYLSCQGFYRYGNANNNKTHLDARHAVLYGANGVDDDVKTPLLNISADEQECLRLDINSIQGGFTNDNKWPNTFYAAAYCLNYGLYNNGVWVQVKNGNLRLGVRKFDTSVAEDWTAITNFQLKYYGNTTNHPSVAGVNGLQFAVDMAHKNMSQSFVPETITTLEKEGSDGSGTTTNRTFYKFTPTNEHPQVDVWVGAGVYTNHDGFKIRNHVKTYGGFPKTGNPGMNERHPQLTSGVPLSNANQGLNVVDYETVLQTNQSVEERNQFKKSVSVLSHPFESRVTVYDDYNKHHTRTVYEDVEWDGFTIRNGCTEGVVSYNGRSGRRNGGGGVSIYENVTIRNCVIRDNYCGDGSFRACIGRGGGVYCDGGIIENCFIMDNTSACSDHEGENYGGGLYMIRGTMFNTVVTGNEITYDQTHSASIGNGVFFESAKFYNNTIVNNRGGISTIGVWTASAADASLTVYNSIVMDEHVPILQLQGSSTPVHFDHCFLQTTQKIERGSDYSRTEYYDCVQHPYTSGVNANPFALPFAQAVAKTDYRIDFHSNNTNCVNAGTENLGKETYYNKRDEAGTPQAIATMNVFLPDHDMDWDARIQDCRVDIGAYEYNGADEIRPDMNSSRVEEGTAVYYVTEKGYGTTQAFDPANAACAEKLQKVLDAAGRYKYDHPGTRVIVKLAGVDAIADNYNEGSCFKYFPCRTTDVESDNVRVWSIMVPRGVEVWGGYCVDEVLDKTSNDDIAPYFSEDERSVMYHPTFLQTQYDNSKLNEVIKGYHVVTFTDKTFDENGQEREGKTLSSKGVTDRAVLDGLFLTGGQADGESTGAASANKNINQFGGAAIVTDYAHVRNCIIKNNEATYGGALALMNKGLVSGCLIIDNEANYGGGIYVFEDGVSLSTGETNSTHEGADALDENMPHVYTTTIVKNTGKQQGGGLWFSNDAEMPNVRVNSTVLWQNESPDQANVAGQTSPDMPSNSDYSTLEWYPFAYSAVQNIRVSGTSNISVDIHNLSGNRFGVDSETDSTVYDGRNIARDTTQVDYYGLTVFSALCRTGMPYSTYVELVQSLGLSAKDYNNWSRDTIPAGANGRSYIDIGARAYPSSPVADLDHPFLRLFVAQTQDVNMDAYMAMQDYSLTAQDTDPNYIYGLLGSSFAYPFQNLDDALEYIGELRKCEQWRDKANNMPFEICIARGDYFPQRDMQGNYGYSLANTYLIPEGVTLMGGFDCNDLYGQYLRPSHDKPASEYTNVLANNVERFGVEEINLVGTTNKVEVIQRPLNVIAEQRDLEDLNLNNIKEPWEFRNQTNLSGNTVNLQNSGVYHVVSVIPYAPGVGQLPLPSYTNPNYELNGQKNGFGYESKEIGQPVIIDGVHISDGYARDYVKGSLTDIGIYDYYRGGGLQGTGNWYCSKINGEDDNLMHRDMPNAVAYRDIPLYVRNSQFINNQAGSGAAMDVNISTHIYNCLFAQNKALTQEENIDWMVPEVATLDNHGTRSNDSKIIYPGTGGAISFAKELEVYNTIFSNNEAEDAKALSKKTVSFQKYPSLLNMDPGTLSYGGAGGAIFGGECSHLKVLNCDFVKNKASLYPAIYTLHPNQGLDYDTNVTEADYNLVANSVFWGNTVPASVTSSNRFAQKLCINYGKKTASGIYDADLSQAPQSQTDLDKNYSEALWFSGYEMGCASTSANNNDYREIHYDVNQYIGKALFECWKANYSDIATSYEVQNGNITLSSNNDDIEGPNFCNPSTTAGYDGYNEAADWSRARLNNLTDNGSCFLNQNVINEGKDGYVVRWKDDVNDRYEGDGAYYQTHYLNAENMYSMDLGNSLYMQSVATDVNLPRVAPDPSPTHDKAYIDLGVYEYPHSKLIPSTLGDAVDILWVSTIERPENGTPDGKTWETPTSDFQRALETLMASRNSHRKEIRVMDGEYAPIYTHKGYKAFYLNTQDLNNQAYFDEDAYEGNKLKYNQSDIDKYYVRSLTIKGGYSKELRDQYDTELYPVTFRQSERLDGTSETWNYLFLIDDATQRYGKGDDTMTGYGARARSDRYVSAIPVQFDGVHLINNQALPGTHGAAIRYDDQVNTYVHEGKTYTNYVNAPESANISISKEMFDEMSKDPQLKYEVHRTYWEDDTYTIQTQDDKSPYVLYYRTVNNPSKLTLTKCCVMNSGTHYDVSTSSDHSSSAVYIGQYGGDALIYNSVFHSNWGNPLEAYNTRTINNTVAMNYGRWILKNQGNLDQFEESGSGEGNGEMLAPGKRLAKADTPDELVTEMTYVPRASKIMNTVMWRNNPSTANGSTVYGQQFSLDGYVSDQDPSSNDIFRRNSYIKYNEYGELMVTEGTDYNDVAFTSNYWNTYLSLANDNISHGPNFKNPILNATDASQGGEIEQRDFSLQPSVRLVDKGDKTIYANEVFDLAWIPTTEMDYLDQNRVISLNIEVGAIEYPHPLLRVIYVDPTQNENKSGISWSSTMNAENLQNAIDMAAIYSATNRPLVDADGKVVDRNEAYVFVKGNNDTKFPEVILRNGVNIFASVDPNVNNDSVRYTIDERTGQYIYPNLQEDVDNIVKHRPGLVGAGTERTIVPSVSTGENNTFDVDRPTRIDGVIVSAKTEDNATGAILTPALDIDPTSSVKDKIPAVAISNVVVSDNDATSQGINVANVNNALIYEVLFRDNKADKNCYVLNLGKTGYGVNLTVEGKTNDASGRCEYPTTDDQAISQSSHIWYSIYNYADKPVDENTLSGHNYPLQQKDLNYQLTEHSKNIDRCPAINPMTLQEATKNLVEFINYESDVDLLANPRVLDVRAPEAAKKLDRGAFETWCIGDDANGQTVYTNVNPAVYSGNYYPHEGSVVYLLKNSNLISEAHSLVPGYLLVKKGASLFAHGQTVKASYVAVERDIKADGDIVAVPYAMDYNHWSTTDFGPATGSYDENGVLTLTSDPAARSYTYNGQLRASARYQIQNSGSKCWDLIAQNADPVAACQGVFFTCSQDTVYRFTGRGTTMKNYIYSEQPVLDAEGNLITTAKIVNLKQNNFQPTDGFGNLTGAEDMGWNCFGIPYLVSEYKPYQKAYDADYNTTASTLEYMLQLPKNLWLYYDAAIVENLASNNWTAKDAQNYAGFYAVESWKNSAADWHLKEGTPSLWVGEGMFAQTASYADEELYFYLPIFHAPAGAAPVRRLTRTYVGEVIEDEMDKSDALENTIYDLQGHKIQNPAQHGVYIVNGKRVWM